MLIQPLQEGSVPYVPRLGQSVDVAAPPPTVQLIVKEGLVDVGIQLSPLKFALHAEYLALVESARRFNSAYNDASEKSSKAPDE